MLAEEMNKEMCISRERERRERAVLFPHEIVLVLMSDLFIKVTSNAQWFASMNQPLHLKKSGF